ncbi:hypothetical protein C8J56DRAFT_821382 [Mycena floridula]|nr:hypothetical protein C8J56DRAFT_821382 [Mycena floridula]
MISGNDLNAVTALADDIAVNEICGSPTRHPDLSFSDGNIAILAGNQYFVVHQGYLGRHSRPFAAAIDNLECCPRHSLEGFPALQVEDSSDHMLMFLLALYDGVSEIKYSSKTFPLVATLLRMSTKYQVSHLRKDLLRGLSISWPSSLAEWDMRESLATSDNGAYDPRNLYPHPTLIINLARDIGATELLPSAFYDLSRYPPSQIISGCSNEDSTIHRLSPADLMDALKGREHASRFLSTFIVNEMEGRAPATACVYQKHSDMSRRRTCQATFEAITFEILRDNNENVCHRSSDPLFAIMDAVLLQSRTSQLHSDLLPCEPCQLEFRSVVEFNRETFWRKLPEWFGVDLESSA